MNSLQSFSINDEDETAQEARKLPIAQPCRKEEI